MAAENISHRLFETRSSLYCCNLSQNFSYHAYSLLVTYSYFSSSHAHDATFDHWDSENIQVMIFIGFLMPLYTAYILSCQFARRRIGYNSSHTSTSTSESFRLTHPPQ